MSYSPLILRAGPMEVDYADGFLRYLRQDGREVVRMIYFALRDPDWGTPSPVRFEEVIEQEEDAFSVRYRASYPDLPFRWEVRYTGAPDGQIECTIIGHAGEEVHTNRAGFCIHHPPLPLAGTAVTLRHVDGSTSEAKWPLLISPHQPFQNLRGMQWVSHDRAYSLEFRGDTFETEDQRNWLDASYKTYCRPLSLPFPYRLMGHAAVKQTIRFCPLSVGASDTAPTRARQVVSSAKIMTRPPLGLRATEVELSAEQLDRLRLLNPSFLRLTLDDFSSAGLARVAAGRRQVDQLNVPLYLVLSIPPAFSLEHIEALTNWVGDTPLFAILLLSQGEKTTAPPVATKLPHLRSAFPGVPIGAGTDYYFTEVNRFPPEGAYDFISFSVTPQVHAFDDQSIRETLEAHGDVVHSARALFPGRNIHVGPVTLRPRTNPDATSATTTSVVADPRQGSDFLAEWTMASIQRFRAAGVEALTYFSTVGPQGVFPTTGKPERPILRALMHGK